MTYQGTKGHKIASTKEGEKESHGPREEDFSNERNKSRLREKGGRMLKNEFFTNDYQKGRRVAIQPKPKRVNGLNYTY